MAFLVATLSTSYLLAFGGFLFMLACALYFERNLRKLGKAGLEQITELDEGRPACAMPSAGPRARCATASAAPTTTNSC